MSANEPSGDLLPRIIDLMLPHVTNEDAREELLIEAFYLTHRRIYDAIDRSGTPRGFALRCARSLIDIGCMADKTHCLSLLLQNGVYVRCGDVDQRAIDELLPAINQLCADDTLPPPARVETPPDRPTQSITTPVADRTPTVFISYSHVDAGFAKRLIADLNAAGHACWIDEAEIKGGEAWTESITEGINNSYAFVSVVSADANRSTWVKREYLWAEKREKPIFPVQARDCELPIYMIERQVIAMQSDYTAGLTALLKVLPAAVLPVTVSEADEVKPPRSRRALELDYLDRLRFEEFNSEQYTALAGESQFTPEGRQETTFRPLMMPQEFEHTPWSRDREQPRETRKFDDAVSEMLAIKQAVLLGEPGAGKTTTLWQLAKQLFEVAIDNRAAPIPLLVRLGKWTEADQSLYDFIAAELGDLGVHLNSLLSDKRAVLLLDGLNELPVAQRKHKYPQVQQLIEQQHEHNPDLLAIVTCREQDYRDIELGFDRIVITPLDPLRVREFVTRYLGAETGEALFWKLAGEAARNWYDRFRNDRAEQIGVEWERVFWLNEHLPNDLNWGWSSTNNNYWENWLRERANPGSLMQLARNPYMLSMLTQVYVQTGDLPDNRGELFADFVEMLLVRERIVERDKDTKTIAMTDEARQLLAGLANLAYEMQIQRGQAEDGSALTVLNLAVVKTILNERLRYLAGSASILSIGDEVRFTHQLLQEYFAATYLQRQIFPPTVGTTPALSEPALSEPASQRTRRASSLQASDIWKPERWWERTNWEEAVILLAGLYSDDCTPVLDWVAAANPEVAVQCIVRSGAATPRATLARFRDEWLPRLTDLANDPQPEARAAVGRALGLLELDGLPLDKRTGVSVIVRDGVKLPDIDWVTIPAGAFIYGDDNKDDYPSYAPPANKQQITLPEFQISRYPLTYAQFQAFIDDSEGFYDPRWWQGLAIPDGHNDAPGDQAFKYWNHPRERVSWYDAIALCRWLSWRLGGGYELDKIDEWAVRLPTEFEWERAARGTDGRKYPYEGEFDAAKGNTSETGIGQTSAVGIFPKGASPDGVLDMSGNVWDWCANKYDEPDMTDVDDSGYRRVLRGGSWSSHHSLARAAFRSSYDPDDRYGNYGLGFRLVRAPSL